MSNTSHALRRSASTASAASRPLFSAPSSVAVARWSPHTYSPLPRRTGRDRSVGGACGFGWSGGWVHGVGEIWDGSLWVRSGEPVPQLCPTPLLPYPFVHRRAFWHRW